MAQAAQILAVAADPRGRQVGDDVQSLARREIIALDPLVKVGHHGSVHARARGRSALMVVFARRWGVNYHLRKRF